LLELLGAVPLSCLQDVCRFAAGDLALTTSKQRSNGEVHREWSSKARALHRVGRIRRTAFAAASTCRKQNGSDYRYRRMPAAGEVALHDANAGMHQAIVLLRGFDSRALPVPELFSTDRRTDSQVVLREHIPHRARQLLDIPVGVDVGRGLNRLLAEKFRTAFRFPVLSRDGHS
jgi:hypothetical protein